MQRIFQVIIILLFTSVVTLLSNHISAQEDSEISVTVTIVGADKFTGQNWDINAQLRDKTTDSEVAKDKTTFKVNDNQKIQMILPVSNSTEDLTTYSIFVDASSTTDDIDIFDRIDSPKTQGNLLVLNLTKAR